MIVRMLGRFLKDNSDEVNKQIEEELDTRDLLSKSDFDRGAERQRLIRKYSAYDYIPITFNLKDVMHYNVVDTNHVNVKFYGGTGYIFKISEEKFSSIYQMMLGCTIMDFTSANAFIEQTIVNNKTKVSE